MDLIMALISDIKKAWSKGKVYAALLMDIKGAFDTVGPKRLIARLR